MQFDRKKMVFVNLTDEEKKDLLKVARDIVYKGKIDLENVYFHEWWHECGFEEKDRLLIISTVFATRALDSVIGGWDDVKE